MARSITRACNDGIEAPTPLAARGEKIELEWARPLGAVHVVRALWEALRTAALFNADVDRIFWNTTSVYFEIDDEE